MAAPSPKCLSLLLLLLFSLSAEARVSEFFSKAARFDAADPTKATTTTPAKVEDDPNAFPYTPESAGGGNGYGLYGHTTQDTNPSAGAGEYYSTDTPAQEFHVGKYEGKGSSHAKEYRDVETKQPEEVEFDNEQFAARYPAEKEEYESREPTTRDPTESYYETTFENRPREEELGTGKERAREYDNVDAAKEYEEGRRSGRRSYTPETYGMSDTRKVENGRYFYDVKNDNYRGNPYTTTDTNPSYRKEGFYGATGGNQNEYQDDAYKGAEYQNPQDDPNGYMP